MRIWSQEFLPEAPSARCYSVRCLLRLEPLVVATLFVAAGSSDNCVLHSHLFIPLSRGAAGAADSSVVRLTYKTFCQ